MEGWEEQPPVTHVPLAVEQDQRVLSEQPVQHSAIALAGAQDVRRRVEDLLGELGVAHDPQRLKAQHDLVHATGNRLAVDEADKDIAAVLFAGGTQDLIALNRRLAERPGPIVPVHLEPYPREFLFDEVSLSVNTAAAGGNASLMAIG